jgi:hypothetical protein
VHTHNESSLRRAGIACAFLIKKLSTQKEGLSRSSLGLRVSTRSEPKKKKSEGRRHTHA